MLSVLQGLFTTLLGKLWAPLQKLSPAAVVWGYRLFLDREPENLQVVVGKLKWVTSTEDLRREFVQSEEFRRKNPGFHVPSMSGNEPPMVIEEVTDVEALFTHIRGVWEGLGESDPFWSVWTSEQFKTSTFEEARSEFYGSGAHHRETLFQTLRRNGVDPSSLATCLEYGCGVGRVTYWLAQSFDTVYGCDISQSHLELAEQYLGEMGVSNVSFLHIRSPQDVESFPQVDLVYSVIVLQHNPPPLIARILRQLIRALRPGGVAFFQVPTYREGYAFSLERYLSDSVAKGEMEMHVLPQGDIFEIIQQEGGRMLEVLEDGWTGLAFGERSNTFVVQRILTSS